jgi:hypothetical protein
MTIVWTSEMGKYRWNSLQDPDNLYYNINLTYDCEKFPSPVGDVTSCRVAVANNIL